jgi:membrane protein DedA with SNARE-associated domain/rhodanese-related sulfurtransferase
MNPQLLALVHEHAVLIVFVAVLIDQIGVPFPAIPVLIVAGTMAAAGAPYGSALLAASTIACLLADLIWFQIGRSYGMRVLKTLCRISLEPDSCVSETQNRFERWGANSLIFAKFIPGLAVIAPPLAGALKVGWVRFTVLSTIGAVLWSAAGLGLGIAFRSQIEGLYARIEHYGGLAALLAGAALAAYVGYKWWERRRFYAELRMARISVDELYQMMESGAQPVVVDVRTHTARKLEPRWIPRAIHSPVEEMEHRFRELPRDRDIVVYCTCPNEASAARVAKQLKNHGFKRVRPLLGGLDAWVAAGYVVETEDQAAR